MTFTLPGLCSYITCPYSITGGTFQRLFMISYLDEEILVHFFNGCSESKVICTDIYYAQSYSRQCWLMYLLSKENWNVFFINKIKIAYWIPTITMHLMNFWFFSYRTSIVKLIWLKADGQLSQNAARHCLLSIMHIRNACIFNYINYAHTACL